VAGLFGAVGCRRLTGAGGLLRRGDVGSVVLYCRRDGSRGSGDEGVGRGWGSVVNQQSAISNQQSAMRNQQQEGRRRAVETADPHAQARAMLGEEEGCPSAVRRQDAR
jgi:hypothetical protein